MLPQHLVCEYELNCEYCNIILARNKAPWWWSDKIETCRSVLKCFKVFWKCFMWNYMCIRWLINWSDSTKMHGATIRYISNEHSPYCHLWPVPLYQIFPHYLINGTILGGKKFIEHKMCFLIIIINIKDWTLWSVPSPDLQLLAPTLLRSSNCSPSLWSVVVWFQGDSVLWHSLQVWKPVPSVFIYLV